MKEDFPSNEAPMTVDDANGPDLDAIEEQVKLLEASVKRQDRTKKDVREEIVTMVQGNRRLNKRTVNSPKFNAAFDAALVAKNVVVHKDKELVADEQAIANEESKINSLKKRLSALETLESEQTIISLVPLRDELDKAEIALQAKKNTVEAKKSNYLDDVKSEIRQTHELNDTHKDQQEGLVNNDIDFAIETVGVSKGDKVKDYVRTPEFRSDIEKELISRENHENSYIPEYIEKQRKYLDSLDKALQKYEEELSKLMPELHDIEAAIQRRKWDIIGITKFSSYHRAEQLLKIFNKIDLENFKSTFVFLERSFAEQVDRMYGTHVVGSEQQENKYVKGVKTAISRDLTGQLDVFEEEFTPRVKDIKNRGNIVLGQVVEAKDIFRSLRVFDGRA